jgi:hypothetical protein
MNFSAFKGIVPGTLIVFYSKDAVRTQVNRRIADYVGDELFFAELGDPRVGVFGLSAPNMAWLEDVGYFVRSQPEVKACRTLVLRDMIAVNNNTNEAETENMINEAANPRFRSLPTLTPSIQLSLKIKTKSLPSHHEKRKELEPKPEPKPGSSSSEPIHNYA